MTERKLRYLVVDDSQTMRLLVGKVLKMMDAGAIMEAYNGVNALKVLAEEPVDVILCDWNMPAMSGIELLREVRAMDQFKDIPFIMLTAEAQRDCLAEAEQEGVSGYVTKPFKSGELVESIRSVLAKRRD